MLTVRVSRPFRRGGRGPTLGPPAGGAARTVFERSSAALRGAEAVALNEGAVLDRIAVMRLSRSLGVLSVLLGAHEVDDAGRCRACARWPRRRGRCRVWVVLAAQLGSRA